MVNHRRSGLVAALVLAGVVAAGCGIPTEKTPSAIAPSHVPFGLLSPHLPTTTTTQPRPSSLVPVKVFMLGKGGDLQSVQRVVVSPAPLTAVLSALLAGPTSSEAAAGITSTIPNNVRVLSASVQDNVVTVNFNSAFGQIPGTATELAVSQVMATVTAQVGLGAGVLFQIEGQHTSVPIADGATVPGPVFLLQYVP